MGVELRGFDNLENDLLKMVAKMDNGTAAKKALKAGAEPIKDQMIANASSDPAIDTETLVSALKVGKVKQFSNGKYYIDIGQHKSDADAFYAFMVEYGHGGPGPAPAHPFVRPAFDARQDEAYEVMKGVLQSELDI